MADFDAQQAHAHAQAHQNQLNYAQARIAHLEQTVAHMGNALNNIQNVSPPAPQPQFHPNLNLSPPPPFSGSPLQLIFSLGIGIPIPTLNPSFSTPVNFWKDQPINGTKQY